MMERYVRLGLVLAVVLLCWPAGWAAADPAVEVAAGRQALQNGDLAGADGHFRAALAESPNHQAANFFATLTGIAMATRSPTFNSLLDRLGVDPQGRDLFNWTADLPRNHFGDVVLPGNAPGSGELIQGFIQAFFPPISAGLGRLDRIQPSFVLQLAANEWPGMEAAEVDYGDVLMLRGACLGTLAWVLSPGAYNLNVDIDKTLSDIQQEISVTPRSILRDYPNLLKLQSPQWLSYGRLLASAAIDAFVAAYQAMAAETDDQSDDLIGLDPGTDVQGVIAGAREFQMALSGPQLINNDFVLDLSQFFVDRIASLRTLLPEFTEEGPPVANSFPDPTFSGILPQLTQWDLVDAFDLMPEIDIWTNMQCGPGCTLTIQAWLGNMSFRDPVDLYLALAVPGMPGGQVLFITRSGVQPGRLDQLASWQPYAAGLRLPLGLDQAVPLLGPLPTAGLPSGWYQVYAFFAPSGHPAFIQRDLWSFISQTGFFR
ncbi:MAG: hypothetical protein AB1634_06035 [Thermodesulfobacteriota bacterium]